MLSFLSSKQRALLMFALMAAGQVCVIAGLTAGWSPTATIAGSLVFSVLVAFVFIEQAAAACSRRLASAVAGLRRRDGMPPPAHTF
jgi:hypothetical protein